MNGYLSEAYANSLSEFGAARRLPQSGGWVLERPIPGIPDRDAMGCYPLFCCKDWSGLHLDVEALEDDLVSVAVVTDPFGTYDVEYLQRCFRDVVIPFKQHHVVDLRQPIGTVVSRNVRYNVRKAFKVLEVDLAADPKTFLEDWTGLYTAASQRFNIQSVRAFSPAAFEKMFDVPGLLLYRASHQGETVGIALVMVQDEIAYGHLFAISERGYKLDASYALYWFCIDDLSQRCRWLDLGGTPGTLKNERDGLKDYKSQWSTDTRTAYFCGRILHRERYDKAVRASGVSPTDYFPAYRSGEFS